MIKKLLNLIYEALGRIWVYRVGKVRMNIGILS